MALSTETSSTPTPSAHPVGNCDVFLSFGGKSCKDLVDNLCKALQGRGITVFMDDEEHTDPCLSAATINSRFAIVVLSQQYASSICCLDKLSTISQCMRGRIIPIFYEAEPSDLRHQRGCLKTIFDLFEIVEDMTKVERWKTALREVCDISGWASTHCDTKLIKEIVEHFSKLRCEVCHEHWRSISADSSRIGYVEHPFWQQYYCHSHEGDGTSKCCSCDRLEPRDTQYLLLDDGRHLCPKCQESAIFDTDKCQSLYLEVQKFYERHNLRLGHQIPVLQLVDRQTIIDRRVKKGEGDQNSLCCEAKEILIWYGLPRLLTGSLVAQEMMKAWIMLNFYPDFKLSIEDEEGMDGICAVIAHRWLEYSESFLSTKFEKKLVEFRKYQIDSSHYGEAFCTAKKAVRKYGLSSMLEGIVPLIQSKLVKSRQRVYTSSPSANPWKYDVFLSFRGETRDGFTAGLYKALTKQGINVFMDFLIEKGAIISKTLFTAIKQSRFAIPVLSENYASSTWCLKELSDAFGCTRVFPVFYDVEPYNVHRQTNSFAQPFEKYREIYKLDEEQVCQWETTLSKVANITGWLLQDGLHFEAELISEIVEVVCERVVCAGCNTRINEPSYFKCIGHNWHRECFCCYACDLPFTDHEFWVCEHPFHQSCHKLRCDVCKHLIPENTDGEIEYWEHPLWPQKYCRSHEENSKLVEAQVRKISRGQRTRQCITEDKLIPRPLNIGLEGLEHWLLPSRICRQ